MTTSADGNIHLLGGAYALNALDDGGDGDGDDGAYSERAAFEAHLAGCGTCEEEAVGFGGALARIATAQAPVAPPAELRARILARTEVERQLPPLPRPVGSAETAVTVGSAETVGSAVSVGSTGSAVTAPRAADHLSRARRWPRFALAASLAAATGLGVVAVQQHEQVQQERAAAGQLRAQQAAFGELLTAPDARVTTTTAAATEPGTAGTGTVVWSASRNQAGFLAAGLPDPAPGRVYELWLDHNGTLTPAGLLPDGNGALVLTAPLDGARAVGVTDEPAGGSERPTTQPVMALRLTQGRAT
ncbi:anti-sigma factor [Kitasatospora purpeofusca]|uniref:anti-sigma factor n=1 Tax=Kitasatospora purpeofusca TaxID=67352 RepID=UPI0036BB2383